MNQPSWTYKPLDQMSLKEWELVCDGCGKCCLHKLKEDDTGTVFDTNVACHLLDKTSCQCGDYQNRLTLVPGCFKLTPQNIAEQSWLPSTCAYRLLYEGSPLPGWHHLVSGNIQSVHSSGMSAQGRIVSEHDVCQDEMEDYIVQWIN
jgi:uncharacterized protein|tara:strand:+ start:4434 stop:4874 length:441 start_codon:yes stop_codon:yes gene_type:complete